MSWTSINKELRLRDFIGCHKITGGSKESGAESGISQPKDKNRQIAIRGRIRDSRGHHCSRNSNSNLRMVGPIRLELLSCLHACGDWAIHVQCVYVPMHACIRLLLLSCPSHNVSICVKVVVELQILESGRARDVHAYHDIACETIDYKLEQFP